uniref:Ulp1 protease-like n=1 Tax=Oryza glaberrima TaxID=4538 RepID=I1QLU9_ORYGL
MTINTRPPEATTYKSTRCENAISDLARHGFEEEDYPVVDYESDLQTDVSTTVR